MAKKTAAGLTANLVATKGAATAAPVAGEEAPAQSTGSSPLNFKVPPEFRRRFRERAAQADLKLNKLLYEALDAWEEKRGLKQ